MAGGLGAPSAFLGRSEVTDALLRRFEEASPGSFSVTILVGESGVGKSTLLDALVPRLRAHQARVLIGRSPPIDPPLPFALLQAALESATDDPLVRQDADPRFGAEATVMGFVPGLLDGGYRDPPSFEAGLLDAMKGGRHTGTKAREERLAAVAEQFLELTRHGPLVLVLEDLWRADLPSLAAVEFFVRELAERPIWILATTRPAEQLTPAERARVEQFEQATHAQRISLRPFNSEEMAEYLRRLHPSQPLPPAEIERLYAESGGNPYLLQQFGLEVPGATSIGSRRIRAPPGEEAQEVLELAAVLGPAIPFPVLLRACEWNDERLAEVIDRLVALGLLTERAGEIVDFPQDRLREEVYRLIPGDRRQRLHRRAGDALEKEGPADPARIYALARHFDVGGDAEKAVRYLLLAAEIAERALAPEVAWEHTTHALEIHRRRRSEDLDGEADLVLRLARITDELGVLREADTMLREFLDRTAKDPRLSPARKSALEVLLCQVLAAEGDLSGTAELARGVLAAPGLEDQWVVQIGAHHHLGMALYYDGEYEPALAQHDAEIRLAREAGSLELVLRARIWRIANLQMLGRITEAIAEAREVTADRDRLGSAKESAQAHLYLGDILSDARSPPSDRRDARQEYAKAAGFSEQSKDPRRLGWALYRTSELLREEGNLAEAGSAVDRACHLMELVGDQVGYAAAIRARGTIALSGNAPDRAEADLTESLRLLRGTHNTLEEIDTTLRLARLRVVQRNWEAAEELLTALRHLDSERLRPDLTEELRSIEAAIARRGDLATAG